MRAESEPRPTLGYSEELGQRRRTWVFVLTAVAATLVGLLITFEWVFVGLGEIQVNRAYHAIQGTTEAYADQKLADWKKTQIPLSSVPPGIAATMPVGCEYLMYTSTSGKIIYVAVDKQGKIIETIPDPD